jgi:plasmid maintenance system antidote protein VapI
VSGGYEYAAVEARRYRTALRHSGLTVAEIARALVVPKAEVERLLKGKVRLLPAAKARRAEALFSGKTQMWLRESPRYEGVNAERIPMGVIRPLIESAFESHTQYAVEAMAGIPIRSLTRVLRENHGSVSFAVADRIVTGIDAGMWHEPPLRAWYWSTVLGR